MVTPAPANTATNRLRSARPRIRRRSEPNARSIPFWTMRIPQRRMTTCPASSRMMNERSSFLFGLLARPSVHAGPSDGVWPNFTEASFSTLGRSRFQIALRGTLLAGAASSVAFNQMPTPDKTPLPLQVHRRARFAARI